MRIRLAKKVLKQPWVYSRPQLEHAFRRLRGTHQRMQFFNTGVVQWCLKALKALRKLSNLHAKGE